MRRLGLLFTVTLSLWALVAAPIGLFLDGPPILVTLSAALICLFPAALTLILLDRLRKRTPEEKVVATLVAPFIRMILSGGGGFALYTLWPLIREHDLSFVSWAVVFYLVTLAVETGLLYYSSKDAAATEPSNR